MQTVDVNGKKVSVKKFMSMNGLRIDGNLDLSERTDLISLPQNLTVGGNLDLLLCTGLTSLPDDLKVGGWMSTEGCPALAHITTHNGVAGGIWSEDDGVYAKFTPSASATPIVTADVGIVAALRDGLSKREAARKFGVSRHVVDRIARGVA